MLNSIIYAQYIFKGDCQYLQAKIIFSGLFTIIYAKWLYANDTGVKLNNHHLESIIRTVNEHIIKITLTIH